MTEPEPSKVLDADTFCRVGEALFGSNWQGDMARALGINERTIRRMVAGDMPVSAGVWRDIANLCVTRGKSLETWAAALAAGH
jgi:plasmid maintenance system antidote protein VapI